VAHHGWSGCTSCSLLGRASVATAASCHRLTVTPLTGSNDLITVTDLCCLLDAAVACVRVCFNVSVKCECGLISQQECWTERQTATLEVWGGRGNPTPRVARVHGNRLVKRRASTAGKEQSVSFADTSMLTSVLAQI